ncbi:MAG: septum formation protein Maf [Chlamydiae bacterium]|nr:septum formation protein Maf [Chlamydiota bacterium]
MHVILGSASPRRREILQYFSLPFEQIPSHYDEEQIPFLGDPIAYVKTLSEEKGKWLSQKHPNSVVLTADTVVYANQKVYNKPKDSAEAFQFLQEFSGNWNEIYTAVSVRKGNQFFTEVEVTRLLFHTLSKEQMQKYHSHFYFADKSGGFAVEKSGSILLQRIEGCFYNILGLPINAMRTVFLKVGIDLWDFLKSENEL